ncbi:MAG: glycoside hydrolase family 15 protein [Chloroflexota bacterium]|nr:glycoside hydrolase family 15 protein [Chloroflexota bacterium]
MPNAQSSPYLPISDYGVVGDCHSAALIARDGSVDWFCPGRFDAPAVFCRLLDVNKGGYLRTAPKAAFVAERRYRGSTNVLETTFSIQGGRVRATDLMPVHPRISDKQGYDVGTSRRLLRHLECLDGDVEIDVQFKPTFDFARARTVLEPRPAEGAIAHADSRYLTLACAGVDLVSDGDGRLVGSLRLRAGDERWVVLTYADDPDRAEEALRPVRCEEQLERTLRFWEGWADKCTYRGPYRDQVLRSALVLKLLTYEPTGAVVAAPTTSLPENVGGERNWDYRYTWLRDSSLILYALLTVGYQNEAADFIHWLEQTLETDLTRRPQIMYGIDGRPKLPEQILDHLDGYRGSRPVRVGNAAADQRQIDIFGEVLRAAALYYGRHGDARTPPSSSVWDLLRDLVERAAKHWNDPGNGIWEVRGAPQPFLYGKLMCWAALDAGLGIARKHGLQAPTVRWGDARDKIRQAILEHGYDTQLAAFTQAFGNSTLDASALVMPRIGFLPPTDPRVRSTVEQIRRHLTQGGLVYRYRTTDGLAGGEGTFTLCSFWLVEALALGGRLDDARELFERMLGHANDLGLLAEEINPQTSEQLGNFPQGFSHMALIGAAVNLAKAARNGPEQQPENESERSNHAESAARGAGS